MAYLFIYIWLIFRVNVCKYTSPMTTNEILQYATNVHSGFLVWYVFVKLAGTNARRVTPEPTNDTSPCISRHHEFQRIAQPQLEKCIPWGSQRVYGISVHVGSHGWRASINRSFQIVGKGSWWCRIFLRVVSTISLKEMHGNIMWHLSIGKFHYFTNLDFLEIRGSLRFFGFWYLNVFEKNLSWIPLWSV